MNKLSRTLETGEQCNLFIIIPVFNEKENIVSLFDSLKSLQQNLPPSYNLEIIIVDDGSHDNTVKQIHEEIKYLKVVLLRHEKNKGPGTAFGTAFEYLFFRLSSHDWIFTMEGDNTSDMDVLMHMLQRKDEGYDAVFASPYVYGGLIENVPLFRIFITYILVVLIKIIMGLRGLSIFSSFLRLYSGDIILRLQKKYGKRIVESNGFENVLEILAKLVILCARISEVEMNFSWSRRKGKSKMRILRTIKGYLKVMLRFNFIQLKREKAKLSKMS